MATKIKMKTLKVQTIYPAFMGEVNEFGIGAPCVFVRLAGCNLRCYANRGMLCDTPEALSMKSGKEMTIGEIVTEVMSYGANLVCLTGGEPLLQDVYDLLEQLNRWGISTVIETNGSVSIQKYHRMAGVSFVVDVKGKDSGEDSKMLEENYKLLTAKDYVKFVINTESDFVDMYLWITKHKGVKCKVAAGLFWGSEITYKQLFYLIKKYDVNVYVNMQTHKLTCLYDREKNNLSSLEVPRDL